MKENDVVLKSVTKIVVFILLTFGFYVFFAGHNNPGGGFIGSLISVATASVPMFFGKPFLYQTEANVTFPLLGHVHVTTVTLFELGILLTVVGVIVTVMLSISGGRS